MLSSETTHGIMVHTYGEPVKLSPLGPRPGVLSVPSTRLLGLVGNFRLVDPSRLDLFLVNRLVGSVAGLVSFRPVLDLAGRLARVATR